MKEFFFGNLTDWRQVMEELRKLKDTGKLGDCQNGLITILRYRDNWRLRETVLEYVKDINDPSPGLVHQVLLLLTDEGIYYELRVLAANALGVLTNRVAASSEQQRLAIISSVTSTAKEILRQPQAPILHDALRLALAKIRA